MVGQETKIDLAKKGPITAKANARTMIQPLRPGPSVRSMIVRCGHLHQDHFVNQKELAIDLITIHGLGVMILKALDWIVVIFAETTIRTMRMR